jgi:hypothetical protein
MPDREVLGLFGGSLTQKRHRELLEELQVPIQVEEPPPDGQAEWARIHAAFAAGRPIDVTRFRPINFGLGASEVNTNNAASETGVMRNDHTFE